MVFLDTTREEQPARTGKGFRPLMDLRPLGARGWGLRAWSLMGTCSTLGGRRWVMTLQ